MRMLLVCSATGGAGKSTACLRLAETLVGLGVTAGILDLSPYPTTTGQRQGVTIARGAGVTTLTAAQALLRPLRERHQVLLVDGPALGDEALECWLPLCTDMMIVTRVDAFALNSIPAIWTPLEELRRRFPSLNFLGFLPTMVGTADRSRVGTLRAAAREFVLPTPIPLDEGEALAAESVHFTGLSAIGIPPSQAVEAYRQNAEHLVAKMKLTPAKREEPKPATTGLLAKAWRTAASLFRTQKPREVT